MNAKNGWFEQSNLRVILLFSIACSFIYLDNEDDSFKESEA